MDTSDITVQRCMNCARFVGTKAHHACLSRCPSQCVNLWSDAIRDVWIGPAPLTKGQWPVASATNVVVQLQKQCCASRKELVDLDGKMCPMTSCLVQCGVQSTTVQNWCPQSGTVKNPFNTSPNQCIHVLVLCCHQD